MTEYELADLVVSLTSAGTPVLVAFITLVSGFLIVAWLVGAQLSKSQTIMVSALYFGFSAFLIFAWFVRFQLAMRYAHELMVMNPDRVSRLQPELIFTATLFLAAILMVSLKFMWDVRHPKPE